MTSSRNIIYSSKHRAELQDYPVADIDEDKHFSRLFDVSKNFTMTGKEAMYGLYQAVSYVVSRGIPGDFVECGVWRGGSSLLAGLAFRDLEVVSKTRLRHIFSRLRDRAPRPRRLWLYDTYEGMTAPTEVDVEIGGKTAQSYIEQYADDGRWCYAAEADVRQTLIQNGLDESQFQLVKGDVCQTLKSTVPSKISILRLDTDWYESTKVEMEVLYPLLSPGGVLIIDDYGHWEGSRKAIDEYFKTKPIFLHRTTYAVRTGIKI